MSKSIFRDTQIKTLNTTINVAIDKLKEINTLMKVYHDIKKSIFDYDKDMDSKEIFVLEQLARIQDNITRVE